MATLACPMAELSTDVHVSGPCSVWPNSLLSSQDLEVACHQPDYVGVVAGICTVAAAELEVTQRV